MTEVSLLFLAGVAGSMHCIGMCGGFACAIGGDVRGRVATLQRQLVYNVGRVTTYCFVGAVVGHLGFLLIAQCGDDSIVSLIQRALAALSGALMVYIGLQFCGVFRHPSQIGFGGTMLAEALRNLIRAPGLGGPLAFGVLNGFLPCPLVYAIAAQAAASGGPGPGFLTMAVFGLGTFPAMLLVGGLGAWWGKERGAMREQAVQSGLLPHPAPHGTGLPVAARRTRSGGLGARRFNVLAFSVRTPGVRAVGVRLSGAFIVALGLITLARGLMPMANHLHLP